MKLIDRLTNDHYMAKTRYPYYLEHLPLDDKAVLLESQQGTQFNGNMYYLARELTLNPTFSDYRVYFSVRKRRLDEAREFFRMRGLDKVQVVETFSDPYYRLVASAKYLMNDNTFLFFFVKRPDQVYLNTWHGTPLKTLGKKIANDLHNIGNAQRNFLFADYLLFQSEYMAEHMIKDYMLENLCRNTVLIDGAPRNSVLLDVGLRRSVRDAYGLAGKRVIVYMPTWRGSLGNKKNPITKQNLEYVLEELDSRLDPEKYAIFVNLHPVEAASLDFDSYQNIREFPAELETYEFLCAADTLVTDYSSVFFDYAVTGRQIILYAFDKAHYCSTRGMYLELSDLPFPVVETMRDLIAEIEGNAQRPYPGFIKKYCENDDACTSERVLNRVLLGQIDPTVAEKKISDNGKKNVLIYVGQLARNGITSSLKNLLNILDLEENNYILLFHTRHVRRNLDTLKELASKVNYLTIKGTMNLSVPGKIWMRLWSKRVLDTDQYMSRMHRAYQLELRRILGDARVDTIIHFTGYGAKQLCLFSEFQGNKIVFVHANVRFEISEKHNLREDAARYAYRHYDHVAAVSEDMIPPVLDVSGGEGRIDLCENAIDYKSVLEKAEQEIDLEDASVYPNVHRLENYLEKKVPLFINVGRFSVEKGQSRLLDAFRMLLDSGYDANLIIMGGNGVEYNNVVRHAEDLGLSEKVLFIKNMRNPFPLVQRCDYSVLTSFAESFGLVLAEADILGVPVFSTDIPGPRLFMGKHGGLLVENSTEGILDGLKRCIAGDVHPLNVDYRQYNENIVKEFKGLLG